MTPHSIEDLSAPSKPNTSRDSAPAGTTDLNANHRRSTCPRPAWPRPADRRVSQGAPQSHHDHRCCSLVLDHITQVLRELMAIMCDIQVMQKTFAYNVKQICETQSQAVLTLQRLLRFLSPEIQWPRRAAFTTPLFPYHQAPLYSISNTNEREQLLSIISAGTSQVSTIRHDSAQSLDLNEDHYDINKPTQKTITSIGQKDFEAYDSMQWLCDLSTMDGS